MAQILTQDHTHFDFFAGFQWNMLGNLINIKNFIVLYLYLYGPFLWMGFKFLKATATSRRQFTSLSSEKFLLKPPKITIFQPNLCKKGVPKAHPKKTKNNFFSEIAKPDCKLSRPFYFNKISYVLAESWMFFYFVWCFFAKKCHFQP